MYRFVKEDDGSVIEVDFETMMEQDAAGFITLEDGTRARRVFDAMQTERKREKLAPGAIPVSDALGFTEHQLIEFEADRLQHGFRGVEFVRDPSCPVFYQVKFGSHAEREAYIAHRGMVDKGRSKGGVLSEKDLENAKSIISRIY